MVRALAGLSTMTRDLGTLFSKVGTAAGVCQLTYLFGGRGYPLRVHSLDPTHLLNTYGTWGLIAIIFAECGLFFCFFFPGDSLLVTAGLLASTHKAGQAHFNIALVLVGCLAAALIGDQLGYAFGRRVGPAIFSRPESRFFKPRHLQRAHTYLDERGPRMIVSARFVPGVRTFMPIVAGAG